MMKYQTFLVVFALVIIQGHRSESVNHDILILSQQWLPSFCQGKDSSSLRHFCSVVHQYERWNLHGLWPYNSGTSKDIANIPLIDGNIATMKNQLENNWIDVFAVNNKQPHKMRDFWEYQWKKHGTCVFDPNDKNSQWQYFKTALNFFNKYNMDKLLNKAGIVPGKEYTHYDLTSKIEKEVGKKCELRCVEDNTIGNTKKYLSEIWICFRSRDYLPTDCKGSSPENGRCSRTSNIIYSEVPAPSNIASAPRTNTRGFGPRGPPGPSRSDSGNWRQQ